MEKRFFSFWALVTPSSIEGQWVAHALDFDVVSQGNSIEHALEMLREATIFVIESDLNSGREPHDRVAPTECFEDLYDVLKNGQPYSAVQRGSLPAGEIAAAAVAMVLCFTRKKADIVNVLGDSFEVPTGLIATSLHGQVHC